jgi:hypothetical protein
MKTRLTLLHAIMAAAILAITVPLVKAYTSYMTGIYIDASTNTVTVAGVSTNVGWVAGSTTNTFNLGGDQNSQADTNKWPSISFGAPYGINSRYVALHWQFASRASDTSTKFLRLAASTDNVHWVSNFVNISLASSGTAYVNLLTNIDTGGYPFLAVQEIWNTNSVAVTNQFIGATAKPGL